MCRPAPLICKSMKETAPLKIYNEFHGDIQAIFRSRLLTQILLVLGDGTKPLSVLRDVTGSSSQALIPKIRQLEALHYVESVRGDYALTPMGRLVEPEIGRLAALMGVFQRHREFWVEHEIEGIPPGSLIEIAHLYNAEVIRDVEEDIFAVYATFLSILKKASWIHGVSSVMSPVHANVITEAILDGKEVELIVSQELAPRLIDEQYSALRRAVNGHTNFRIYISSEPIRLGMTVTDAYLSLGLYKYDTNSYDAATDFVSTDTAAVAWGERLFKRYKSTARILQVSPE